MVQFGTFWGIGFCDRCDFTVCKIERPKHIILCLIDIAFQVIQIDAAGNIPVILQDPEFAIP